MPIDASPGEIVTRTRDGIRDKYLQDYSLRVPEADVGPGTQPFVDASTFADAQVLVVNDALVIGRGTNLRTSASRWLRDIGEPRGIFPRSAVGGTGFVTVSASSGGGTILAGTELFEPNSGLRYQATATDLYLDGEQLPIAGIDTGPSTNLKGGIVVQFRAAPPGIGPNATVVLQTDGTGLSGGREADDDEAYRQLIQEAFTDPPAAGNEAEYAKRIEDSKTHGVAVERAFIYPAMKGPGTTAFTFTIRPVRPGASRIPNAAELTAVLASLTGALPADDGIFGCTLVAEPVSVALRVVWAASADGFADASPWPPYVANDAIRVIGTPTPTATSFRLTNTAGGNPAPQVGQTIAFFDLPNQVFRAKRLLSVSTVTPGQTWDITVDTTNNVSDTSYTPFATQSAMPFSTSLDSLALPVIGYFDALGPGEQSASLPDPGRRQRRQPDSGESYSSIINNRIILPVLETVTVSSATLLAPPDPTATNVGVAGVSSNLLTLRDLAVFAPV